MKNLSRLLIVTLLVFGVMLGIGYPAYAKDSNEIDLVEVLKSEMTRETLYRELSKKYPEYQLFARMSFSKSRHIESLKYIMRDIGINTENVVGEKINLPNTLDKSLEYAINFERAELEKLEKISNSYENEYTNRLIGNLTRSSIRHIEMLERATEYGIDNFSCNNSRGYRNREQFNDFNNGFERRGNFRFENDWNRGFGMCHGGMSRNNFNRNPNW